MKTKILHLVCILCLVGYPLVASAIIDTGRVIAATSLQLEDKSSSIDVLSPQAGPPSYVYHSFLQSPEGMEVGTSGDLFIADFLGNQIVRITPNGEVSSFLQHTFFRFGPRDLDFRSDGVMFFNDHFAVYVVGTEQNEIVVTSDNIIECIEIGPNGDIFFTERNTGNVVRRDSQGVTEVIASGLGKPYDLVLKDSDELYVAERSQNEILKINLETKAVSVFASGDYGPGDPITLAVESNGHLWVHGNGTLNQYDDQGNSVPFTLNGMDPFQALGMPFANAGGIAFDGNGNLWVGDSPNAKLSRIVPDNPEEPIGSSASIEIVVPGFNPIGFAIAPGGDFFAALTSDPPLAPGKILRITPQGETTVHATLTGSIRGMAMDKVGNIFVSEHILNQTPQITKISPEGSVSTYLVLQGGLSWLAVGLDGALYVIVDVQGKIIRVTDQDTYTDFYINSNKISLHTYMTADPNGGLYLSNYDTGEIGHISPDGSTYTVIAAFPDTAGSVNILGAAPSGDLFFLAHQGEYYLYRIRPAQPVEEFARQIFSDPHQIALRADGKEIYISKSGSIDRIPLLDNQVYLPAIQK